MRTNNSLGNQQADILKQRLWEDIAKFTPYLTLIERLQNDYYKTGKCYELSEARIFLSRVRKDIKEHWKERQDGLREEMIETVLDLYRDCRDTKDRLTALNCLKEINKLNGLYEPEKHQVDVNGTVEISFDD